MPTPQVDPKPNPENLRFSQATDAQVDSVWRLNADSWAAPLSVEVYMARERFLSEQDLTNGGKWKTWLLTLVNSPGDIVASCETFEKRLLVRDARGMREEGGYAIASVFTPAKHRGNGYSGVLLKKVAEWFDGLDEGRGVVSVLYSDIGKKFYHKLGWDTYPSNQLTLEPQNFGSGNKGEAIAGVQLLRQDELKELCDYDISNLSHPKRGLPLLAENQTRIAFLPTFLQACWHFSKEEFISKQNSKVPQIKGAMSASEEVWLYWYHNVTESKLKIQRVVVLDEREKDRNIAELALLLEQAAKEASEWDLKEVVFWNPSEEVRAAAEQVSQRDDVVVKEEGRMESSIPCLRWKGGRKEDVLWDCNEFYAWC